MSIGENIRLIRKARGLTMKDIANKLNITEQAISQYERGIRIPNTKLILKISKILGVKPQEIDKDLSIWEEFDEKFDTERLAKDVKEIEIINILSNGIVTNKDFLKLLNIDTKELPSDLDLNKNISEYDFNLMCNKLNINEEYEAFLYSNYIYKTNDEIFKIVAFYYYLRDKYSIDLGYPNNEYLRVGEELNDKYNLSLNLGYAIGRSNNLLVAKIISNNDSSWNILNELYDFESSYDFNLNQLNFEDKYNLISKLASNLKYELHKIAKERKDIKANFFE